MTTRNAHNPHPVEQPKVSSVSGGPVIHASAHSVNAAMPVQGGLSVQHARNAPRIVGFTPAPGTTPPVEGVSLAGLDVARERRTTPQAQFIPAEEPAAPPPPPRPTATTPTVHFSPAAEPAPTSTVAKAAAPSLDPTTAPLDDVRAVLLALPALAGMDTKIRRMTRVALLKLWMANFPAS